MRIAVLIGLAASIALAAFDVSAAPRLPTPADLQSGYPTSTLSLHAQGHLLAVENDGRLVVLKFPQGKLVQELGEGIAPLWSPTDERLAFYSTRSGTMQLWLWDREARVRQLTHFAAGIDPDVTTRFMGFLADALRYAWSRDGKAIAFVSRVAVADAVHAADEPLVLTSSTPASWTTAGLCALPAFCATRARLRGRELIFEVARQGETLISQLFVIQLDGQITQVTTGREDVFHPVWTADDGSVLVLSVPSGGGSDGVAQTSLKASSDVRGELLKINPRTAERKTLTRTPVNARYLQLDTKTHRLAYLSSDTLIAPTHLEVLDLAHLRPVQIRWQGVADDLQWSGRGTLMITVASDHGERLAELSPESTTPSTLLSGAKVGPWAEDGQGGVVTLIGSEVQYWPAHSRKPRVVFRFHGDDLILGREERVQWRNGRGDHLSGAILLPPDYQAGRRYPLIVDAYPFAGSHGWMQSMGANQVWAAAGYVLFMPGERAPHAWMNSPDPTFAEAGKGPEGFVVGLDDVLSGVDELDRRGIIDPQRMCLYGHSNGGGSVSYLVTQTDRFKCAVLAAPVMTNWLSAPVLQPGGRRMTEQFSGGIDFDRDIAQYVRMSSVFQLYRTRTPMLIGVGDTDAVIDAISVYTAARDAGVDVTLVRYPNQGHVFTGAALDDFWKREMEFFRRHLSP